MVGRVFSLGVKAPAGGPSGLAAPSGIPLEIGRPVVPTVDPSVTAAVAAAPSVDAVDDIT